jgi:hypothetical protein
VESVTFPGIRWFPSLGVHTGLEHVAWYFGSKGIIPLNGMTVKDAPAIAEQWFGAFDRFGPRGTDAEAWGQLPN